MCVVFEYACVYVHAHLRASWRKMLDVLLSVSLNSFETESLHEPKARLAASNPWSFSCLSPIVLGYKYERGNAQLFT